MMEKEFGEYLKTLRNLRNMSQTELAIKSGISSSLISRVENGLRRIPKPETIFVLADALQVSPSKLIVAAGYVFPNTNRELLERIEELTDDEQRQVLDFIRSLVVDPKKES